MDGSRKYHPEWDNPITKEHTWYSLSVKWILTQKLGIPKIQFTDLMKLKKEDQSVDTSILLRRGNKIPIEGVTETKFGAETEGQTIQKLPYLGDPSHKQPPKPDTIAYASKILLMGPCAQSNGWLWVSTSVFVRHWQSLSEDSYIRLLSSSTCWHPQ